MKPTPQPPAWSRVGLPSLVGLAVLTISLVWANWPALLTMVERWSQDSHYSHGFLVPAFSAWWLWNRRDRLPDLRPNWMGLPLVVGGALVKIAGAYFFLEWLDFVSIVPVLWGVSLLIGGWPCLRWAWPALAFLVFMVPLPHRVEYALGSPLQKIATVTSTYALQTLGLPAVAEGYVILINESRIGIVEACNGMGMLFMFFAFTTAMVMVIQRGLVDRIVIFLSAVPIAVFANIVRITLTGYLQVTAGGKVADAFYHDMAGWLMMPLALALVWAELWILSHAFLEPVEPRADAGLELALGRSPRNPD